MQRSPNSGISCAATVGGTFPAGNETERTMHILTQHAATFIRYVLGDASFPLEQQFE